MHGNLASSQKEAELAYKQFRLSRPAWAAKFQLLEAEAMLFRGMYDGALGVLAEYRNTGATDGAIQKLAIEAVALMRQKQPSLASQKLAQAEALCGTEEIAACGEVLTAHAILAAANGQVEEARQFFLKALRFSRSHQDPWLEASATMNLGYSALREDHYDEAVDWSRSAYREALASGFENVAQIAAGNLGWAYYQLGDHDRALEQFVAAENGAEQIGNVRYELKWLSTAGYVYRDSLDWTRAAESYRRALDMARQIDSKDDIVNALEDLAQISELNGKLDDARAYLDQVTPMEGASGSPLSASLLLTEGMLAADKHQFSEAESFFRSIQSDSASPMTIRLSAGYELAKLAEAQGNLKSAEELYRATLDAYDSDRATLKREESQLPFGANAAQIYDSYIQLLVQQGRPDAALATADQSRARTLEQSLDPSFEKNHQGTGTFDPRHIAQATNSTLLFYWLGEKQSYLWAITPARVVLFPLPPEQQIAARVERYRQVLLDLRDPVESGNADGEALYQMLVAPAEKVIQPDLQPKQPVTILADGILTQLNFETLLVPGPSTYTQQGSELPAKFHYLIDDLTLSAAPSLDLLAAARPDADQGQRILLLGNPISPNQDFPTLPMFSFEMARIEKNFSSAQVSVFDRQRATPAAYLGSAPHQYAYIHFVSHAVANRTNPLDSAIILSNSNNGLSNSNSGEESYKLYARDIIQHPIDAKLVTISACNGSGTRAYAGEGLVGLSWAFLRAGAQRVIGALWEVSDDSTPLLMDSLYQGLVKGDSPAVALRHAKHTLLHAQGKFRVPFYWGPFQVYSRR